MTGYALVVRGTPSAGLDLAGFAGAARMHPEMVTRLVALGLLEPERDAAGRLWFTRAHLVTVARLQRLRAGLSLNFAALGVVVDLLDRVAELEAALRRSRSTTGG